MTTFPAIQPGSRAITPGTYPSATFRTLSGRDSRVRHSNAVVGMMAKAEFPLLSESQLESIRSHYVGQYGGHQPFAVPDEFWSGANTPAGFTPSGYQWRYAGKPSIEEITIDTSGAAATLFNVSIELEAVPLAAVVLSGATFNITTTWLPGYKALAATGATWDVAVSWVPGGSSTWGPGIDPYFANVSLLLNGDAFTDLSSNALTVTPQGNAAIVAGQGPFGGGAMAFDGSGDYLSLAATSLLQLGTSDFTVEGWIRLTALPSGGAVAQIVGFHKYGLGSNWVLAVNTGSTLLLYEDSGEGAAIAETAAVFSTNTWYHVAVTRSGNTFRLFVAGTLSATGTSSVSMEAAGYTGTNEYTIGSDQVANSLASLNGLIGPLRITKGIARAITVPTAAFPTA